MSASFRVALYGSGGSARDIGFIADALGHEVVCFVDDDPARQGQSIHGVPVVALEEVASRFPATKVVPGIGSPRARAATTAKALAAGLEVGSLIHPTAAVGRTVTIGRGATISAHCAVTADVRLGVGVQLNLSCTIAHDVSAGDWLTLAPGVNISGNVSIGDHVWFGTGSCVIHGHPARPIRIGDGAVVGAGACVIRDVPPHTTVVGVPARPLEGRDRR